MDPDLPLFEAARAPAGRRRPPRRSVLGWLPLVASLGVFAQVCLGGLRPALAERGRLERAEAALVERAQRLESETARLTRRLEAQRDPIYLERERRRRVDPAYAPGAR